MPLLLSWVNSREEFSSKRLSKDMVKTRQEIEQHVEKLNTVDLVTKPDEDTLVQLE